MTGTPTTNWGFPTYDGTEPGSLKTVSNAQANAAETAMNNASKGFYLRYATKALMLANVTASTRQHATVYGDSTQTNNGEYVWNSTLWIPVTGQCVPHFAYGSAASFNWTTTATDFLWGSVIEGTLTGFSTSDLKTFTCVTPGVYDIDGAIDISGASSALWTHIDFYVNGTGIRRFESIISTSAVVTSQFFSVKKRFSVGDTFKIQIQSNVGPLAGASLDSFAVSFMSVEYRHE